ncbi:hypothetical protein [Nonomuraea dietziae]|uniref:hypothetical protein n=1 Tax=Nonomuraea dietziae TaxID=65515 RepID=UPI0031D4ABD6
MRMYLSSFRMGDRPDQLLALLDRQGSAEVAVIANAMDAQPEDERTAGVERETSALTALGLQPTELDLRTFFDRPHQARRGRAGAAFPWCGCAAEMCSCCVTRSPAVAPTSH